MNRSISRLPLPRRFRPEVSPNPAEAVTGTVAFFRTLCQAHLVGYHHLDQGSADAVISKADYAAKIKDASNAAQLFAKTPPENITRENIIMLERNMSTWPRVLVQIAIPIIYPERALQQRLERNALAYIRTPENPVFLDVELDKKIQQVMQARGGFERYLSSSNAESVHAKNVKFYYLEEKTPEQLVQAIKGFQKDAADGMQRAYWTTLAVEIRKRL